MKLQEELVGIGRQLGGLARRIDMCNSQDNKENVDKAADAMFWNEDNAAFHSDELSRYNHALVNICNLYHAHANILAPTDYLENVL